PLYCKLFQLPTVPIGVETPRLSTPYAYQRAFPLPLANGRAGEGLDAHFYGFPDSSGGSSKGLRTRTPHAAKSFRFRVARTSPWTRAVAAKARSHLSLFFSPRRRLHSATTAASIGRIRSAN